MTDFETNPIGTAKRIEELEAKLAKAGEILEVALRYNSAMHGGAGAYNKRIKDTIAALKGGTSGTEQ